MIAGILLPGVPFAIETAPRLSDREIKAEFKVIHERCEVVEQRMDAEFKRMDQRFERMDRRTAVKPLEQKLDAVEEKITRLELALQRDLDLASPEGPGSPASSKSSPDRDQPLDANLKHVALLCCCWLPSVFGSRFPPRIVRMNTGRFVPHP